MKKVIAFLTIALALTATSQAQHSMKKDKMMDAPCKNNCIRTSSWRICAKRN
ncbi:hypothetical protein JCM19296_2261 [Nonlabens ulvanivorans]|uniref:Uncharacterized protein n=1 Tax=Nonlabens ulvanivorans TaxID=906888 RepID=A0A081DCL8_NONUL|nr:hypothetical protein JCM19296_2261 [Nonlabens ulvanivorans]